MRITRIWLRGAAAADGCGGLSGSRCPRSIRADLPLKPRGVYLITGGLGGIGLTLAHWFAANTSARLMLTARTPLPPRENGPNGWPNTESRSDRDDHQKHQRNRGERRRGPYGRGRCWQI